MRHFLYDLQKPHAFPTENKKSRSCGAGTAFSYGANSCAQLSFKQSLQHGAFGQHNHVVAQYFHHATFDANGFAACRASQHNLASF
jgi:hypothetical protein